MFLNIVEDLVFFDILRGQILWLDSRWKAWWWILYLANQVWLALYIYLIPMVLMVMFVYLHMNVHPSIHIEKSSIT